MKNQLRIIGGEWKRRQLAFASIEGLPPAKTMPGIFSNLHYSLQKKPVRLNSHGRTGELSS